MHLAKFQFLSLSLFSLTDRNLLGINSPGRFDTSLEILPHTNTSQLCFTHPDDNITCEPPIIGNVELLSSPVVAIGDPFRAQITINDDDGKRKLSQYSFLPVLIDFWSAKGGREGWEKFEKKNMLQKKF